MKRLVQFQKNQVLQDKHKVLEGNLSYDKAQMKMRRKEKRSVMFRIRWKLKYQQTSGCMPITSSFLGFSLKKIYCNVLYSLQDAV